ncbi:MAG: bifunctional diguanylate cyclase/phosphodiesterase [Novosphingobium sp.]|uniref:putative bifunctional diguanylate cyclase/phosphodiesterase n=1 Tax=Novosphingobium sp. TaxID=1874826 RepID=UPI003015B155
MGLKLIKRGAGGRPSVRNLRTGWIALATFLALIALSALLVAVFSRSTRIADELAREDERVLVTRYLDQIGSSIVTAQKVQLTWDDAMRNAVLSDNEAWADHFLGDFVWNNLETDAMFLVRPDGSLVHGWAQGRPTGDAGYQEVRWHVEDLIARAKMNVPLGGRVKSMKKLADVEWPVAGSGQPLNRWAATAVLRRGRPAFLTVVAIVPDNDYSLLRREPNYVATVRYLDGSILTKMGSDLVLADISFKPDQAEIGQANAVPLNTAFGDHIGWITWTAKVPGPKIVQRTAPVLATFILFFLGVVAGGAVIVRRMRMTASELKASEAQAQHNALHDAMTGLPNRVYYMQRLRTLLGEFSGGQAQGNLFVAYIDIDGFKLVNDTMGHHVGDELVRQVAHRLREVLPREAFIARFGGDEFVLLHGSNDGAAAADKLGLKIMKLMRQPFVISGNTLEVSVSCGISWGPEQSEDPGELLRRADIALYRAKQRGRGRYRRFTPDMDASVKLRREMEMELRLAITRGELSVAYQPVVDTGSGEIRGFEALLRWNHPERGEIRPDLFVPIAEQGGLMIPLGTWVLRHVFTECRNWPDCDISVNLSPLQIMAGDFIPMLAGLLQETGMDPQRLVFEVTEGVMLDRSAHVIGVLRELNRMGIRVALDDFGIGYSSLSYLRSFQFDRIKIDRSFVQNIERDRDAHSILCAIVTLGKTLRMKVVAEGVETEVQRLLVQAAGCELVQGYLFWAALPAEDARGLLAEEEVAARLLRAS